MNALDPFLVDPPRPGIDTVTGILVIDVDGVLNALNQEIDRKKLPTVPGSSGRQLPIQMVDDEILDVLDTAVQLSGVWLGGSRLGRGTWSH